MTADGSSVALQPGFRDLGDVVAHTMELQGDTLPTLEQTAELLRGALSAVRERDQRSNDVIVDYIRNCTDWTSRTREGLNNIHYYIGTVMPRPDGGLTYIELDHSMPGELKTDKNMSVRDVLINQALGGEAEEEIGDDEVNAYVVTNARSAMLRQLTPRAV